jgi:isocitrate dehydrogenase kinase/phosphatase
MAPTPHSAPHAPAVMPTRAAALILDAFLDYNGRFADITRRARRHFERRDWRQAQRDAVARIDLYDECIAETLARLELLLDDRVRSRALWSAIRDDFALRIGPRLDRELFKTFFNTLSRRFFRTRGVDARIEFVALDLQPLAAIATPVACNRYLLQGNLAQVCARLLEDYPFASGHADPVRSGTAIANDLAERALEGHAPIRAIELLRTVFYREQRAYLVGRIDDGGNGVPLVIALRSDADGIHADAVLTNLNQISQLFGYARSSFQADLPTVGDTAAFLLALLPHKPIGEIYTVLGRVKQGKTERYRHLFHHLAAHPGERIVRAEGERGMVMAVFTPQHYPVVIKVIRDRFAYPKDIARREVMQKYHQVFRHDRVGRLVDAQEFRDLRFPRGRFESELLAELCGECAESVEVVGDDLLLRHCYIERRLRPLNLYAREAAPDAARAAVLDYGQAIKDLARSNIFPGDLLLKNFGVSRIGRVIFYDYDELCLVGDCRFRALPQAREGDETRPLEDWCSVRHNDVFPEQFRHFLGLPGALRDALLAQHAEIFDPAWWSALRERFIAGGHADVAPYPASARLPD